MGDGHNNNNANNSKLTIIWSSLTVLGVPVEGYGTYDGRTVLFHNKKPFTEGETPIPLQEFQIFTIEDLMAGKMPDLTKWTPPPPPKHQYLLYECDKIDEVLDIRKMHESKLGFDLGWGKSLAYLRPTDLSDEIPALDGDTQVDEEMNNEKQLELRGGSCQILLTDVPFTLVPQQGKFIKSIGVEEIVNFDPYQ